MRTNVRYICSFLLITCIYIQVKAELQPYDLVKLSTEALENARYKKAISISVDFLNQNINSNSCTSEILASHLINLKKAYEGIGEEDKFKIFCRDIFNKIDTSRPATMLRALCLISTLFKSDYNQNSMLRHSFSDFGNSYEGIEFFELAYDNIPKDFLEENPSVQAWLHIVKADLYSYGEDFEKAKYEIQEASRILYSKVDKNTPEQLMVRLESENIAALQGLFSEAIEIAERTKKEIEKEGTDFKEWYAINARLSYYYYKLGNYDESIKYGKKALISESAFANLPTFINYRSLQGPFVDNSPSTIFADRNYYLTNLIVANSCFENGDTEEGINRASKVLYLLQKDIYSNYSKFAFNRASSELKGKIDLLVNVAPSYSLLAKEDSLLQSLTYDAAMIYKQLSISSNALYRNIAKRLGNKQILERLDEIETLKKRMEEVSLEESVLLSNQIDQIEANLERHLSARSNVSIMSMPKWVNVRDNLNDNEIAIEFSIANTKDGAKYIASIVKSNFQFPQTIELCLVSQFDTITDICSTTEAYELIWGLIQPYLQNVNGVYFSPVGALNLLPIEYLQDRNKEVFNEKFSVFRLSTTRELAYKDTQFKIEDIILFGGINYELSEDKCEEKELLARSLIMESNTQSENVLNEMNSNNVRAGIKYLPATLDEIHNISDIFNGANLSSKVIEGDYATETSLKQLSGAKHNILHIATHGFSLPHKSRTRLGRILSQNDYRSTFEEQSMGRSGLMFAGVINTLNSVDKSTSCYDDGILTGREISRLDLKDIEIVVLSACQSGLGEVGSEGVAGLQRGFKLAGVKTLVMSLWEVSDEATSILMTKFYEYLVQGLDASESMKKAQMFLRNVDNNKYDNPEYWAAFIILDSI